MRSFALAVADPATVYISVSVSVSGGLLLDGRTLAGPAPEPCGPCLAALGAVPHLRTVSAGPGVAAASMCRQRRSC